MFPQGIACAEGTLYVADQGNNRVQTLVVDGASARFNGDLGRAAKLRGPRGVAVVGGDLLCVSDRWQVVVLSRADGSFLFQFGDATSRRLPHSVLSHSRERPGSTLCRPRGVAPGFESNQLIVTSLHTVCLFEIGHNEGDLEDNDERKETIATAQTGTSEKCALVVPPDVERPNQGRRIVHSSLLLI